ncbi:MAG: hypothetical protein WC613_05845 [Candidatus Aenigmatarchaeota archaeon]
MGIVYIIAGTVAILGALIMAYVLITVSQAIGLVSSATPADIPAGTDIASFKDAMGLVGTATLLGWVWIVSVILSGIFSVLSGVKMLKNKK